MLFTVKMKLSEEYYWNKKEKAEPGEELVKVIEQVSLGRREVEEELSFVMTQNNSNLRQVQIHCLPHAQDICS